MTKTAPPSDGMFPPVQDEDKSLAKKEKDRKKKSKKEKKEKKKKKKKRERTASVDSQSVTSSDPTTKKLKTSPQHDSPALATSKRESFLPLVESSALLPGQSPDKDHAVSLMLFYQYVDPPWSDRVYKDVLKTAQVLASQSGLTGRMRIAKEGFNCTLTSTESGIKAFCKGLRSWMPQHFGQTEFKLTHHLPERQRFPNLKVIPVLELVHYGLEGDKAPPMKEYHGTHLEPADYHNKLAEDNTVVIDVRNHYEAAIGRFCPPDAEKKWMDPKMRKSTEFPVWLDDPNTQEQLKGKQVLMYCTGGIRCERASALLKYKMEHDPAVQDLGIKGVFQLQGGIDKYFKEFPAGGYWKGKNYTFDKRFAHLPQEKESSVRNKSGAEHEEPRAAAIEQVGVGTPMGKCQACSKPWDKYRGKRRCPTCGVPSLICKDCLEADKNGTRKLDKMEARCDLCVEQGVRSKWELRSKEEKELEEYQNRARAKGVLTPREGSGAASEETSQETLATENPGGVTRLFLRNMCRKNMTEEILMENFPGITHIVWRTDRKTGQFFGQGWVEMESPEAAATAVGRSGEKILGRPIHIIYQPPDGKDAWPPPNSSVAG